MKINGVKIKSQDILYFVLLIGVLILVPSVLGYYAVPVPRWLISAFSLPMLVMWILYISAISNRKD